MSKLVSLALVALAAVSAVNAAPIVARATPPAGWIAEILEPYDDYHTRYLAVGCNEKHNTPFFDDCCHPMKKGETLEKNRKPECRPGASPVPSSTPATRPPANSLVSNPTPTHPPASGPTPDPDEGDDCDDDDSDADEDEDEDCDEEAVTSPPVPTHTRAPFPTTTSKPPKTTSNPPEPSPTYGEKSHKDGHVTWYEQKGNAGACGNKHSDSDFIAALDYRTYGNLSAKSKYCGQKIRVSWQGKSVDVVVEDACPSCDNASSVDLSIAAFEALAPRAVGMLSGATWELI